MDYDLQKFAAWMNREVAKRNEQVLTDFVRGFLDWIQEPLLLSVSSNWLNAWSELLAHNGNQLKITELPDEHQEVLDYLDKQLLDYLNNDFPSFGERVAKDVRVVVTRADGPPQDPGPCPEGVSVEEAREWFEKKISFDCYRMLTETK